MNKKIIEKLILEEEELQFNHFTSSDALTIGQLLIKNCPIDRGITIDITKNRQQIFHYSFDDTSVDNDEWVKRKTNLVYRVFKSSFLVGQELKMNGISIEEAYFLPESEFAPHGGCFPVRIKNVGVIGTITVSGLAQEDDHQLVVDTIREYLLAVK